MPNGNLKSKIKNRLKPTWTQKRYKRFIKRLQQVAFLAIKETKQVLEEN